MRATLEGSRLFDTLFERGIRHRPLVLVLGADLILPASSPQLLFLDPGAADRVVTLPAVAAAVYGQDFQIFHTGTTNKITVKNASAVTIAVIGIGGFKRVICSKSAWVSTSAEAASGTLGFYGATPVIQRVGAAQNAITDNSGGVSSDTVLVSSAYQLATHHLLLASLVNAQEFQFDPGFAGKLVSIDARTMIAATTAAKLATITGRVAAGALGGGGVVALTSANTTPAGAKVAGTAITGANAFTSAQTYGFVVSGVTSFVEGSVSIDCVLYNLDMAAAEAKYAAFTNEIRAALVALGLIKGSA